MIHLVDLHTFLIIKKIFLIIKILKSNLFYPKILIKNKFNNNIYSGKWIFINHQINHKILFKDFFLIMITFFLKTSMKLTLVHNKLKSRKNKPYLHGIKIKEKKKLYLHQHPSCHQDLINIKIKLICSCQPPTKPMDSDLKYINKIKSFIKLHIKLLHQNKNYFIL